MSPKNRLAKVNYLSKSANLLLQTFLSVMIKKIVNDGNACVPVIFLLTQTITCVPTVLGGKVFSQFRWILFLIEG